MLRIKRIQTDSRESDHFVRYIRVHRSRQHSQLWYIEVDNHPAGHLLINNVLNKTEIDEVIGNTKDWFSTSFSLRYVKSSWEKRASFKKFRFELGTRQELMHSFIFTNHLILLRHRISLRSRYCYSLFTLKKSLPTTHRFLYRVFVYVFLWLRDIDFFANFLIIQFFRKIPLDSFFLSPLSNFALKSLSNRQLLWQEGRI